jgi:protein SCO1
VLPARPASPLPAALRVAAVVLGGGLLLSGCAVGTGTAAAPRASSAAFHGVEPLGEAPVRPSFVLRDTDGERYDFARETAGRPTLLYFGYTSCPDECPTAMADMAAALRTTPSALRGKTRVVFVTTDPGRDTPQVIRRFLDQFSTETVGLHGTQEQVDAAQRAVGLTPAQQTGPVPTRPGRPDAHEHAEGTAPHRHDGPLGYGVGHTDVIFAFDTDDRMPVTYPGGTRPSDLAADLPLLDPGDAS